MKQYRDEGWNYAKKVIKAERKKIEVKIID